ncbi:MAG: acetyl-CoA carboxylase biotin carboxylase subunit, partial [Candidatus Aminicenantes bacterium RBG_19FT_COMBO_58_17]
GITFIGPPAAAIRLLGDKNRARLEMKKARVPVIPGGDKVLQDLEEAKKLARQFGFPVILKAASGGGGKGMRIAINAAQMEEQFPIAQNEAKSAFGDPSLYMEKYLTRARHIEIQVVADKYGRVHAFGERECSVQRKYQKLIEETPSTMVDARLRRKMMSAAEEAARYLGYQSLGTFEFLVDEKKNYYFMEANTRVQVEHPITEAVYNIDLLKMQLRLAAGEKLDIPESLELRGHAIECRINAEDPETFVPSPGKIDFLVFPGGEGIRVDSAAYGGWEIPPYYDSLLAKIIALAPNRQTAIKKMITALEMTTIVGIKTNLPLHLKILSSKEFVSGGYDTRFMERFLAQKEEGPPAHASGDPGA